MATYPKASDTYINDKMDLELRENLYVPAYNLSSILNDSSGLVTAGTARKITGTLKLTSPGLISINAPDSVLPHLPIVSFEERVSIKAYNLYQSLVLLDSNIVDTSSSEVNSLLLKKNSGLPIDLEIAILSLYLEGYALYLDLLNATKLSGLPNLARSELLRVDRNARWVSYQLETQPIVNYDLISVIRDLQRSIMFVYSLEHLFSITFQSKLKEYESMVSGGAYNG